MELRIPMARRILVAGMLCAMVASPAFAQQPAETTPPQTVVVTPPTEDAPPDAAKVMLTPQAEADAAKADAAKAKVLTREARKLYSRGLYEQAIAKFNEAYAIDRDPAVLYSVAVSHQQLRNWEQCVKSMEDFIAKTPPGPDPILDRARNTRDLCEARIERDQELIVETQPAGAKVYVDNKNDGAKGQTPFRMFLRPGKHRIWLELDGHETVMQDIEVQKREPYRLNASLKARQDLGWLFVDASVKGARVFVDGKSVGLTPFAVPQQFDAGPRQVVVERDGYTRISTSTTIERGQMAKVDAYMVRTESDSSWRTNLGITSIILGAVAIGGGVTAFVFAEDEYNDTDDFDRLAGLEALGYGVGGGLLAVGASLIVWDLSRDVILDAHRNSDYGKPVSAPGTPAAPSARIMVGPGGLGVGGTF